MNKRLASVAAAVAATMGALAGCAAPSGFHWGGYDQALYAYSKRVEAKDEYIAALEGAIAQGKRENRLAPGLQAELGYMRLQAGDLDGAIALFEAEAQSFPESATFMARVIGRLREVPAQPPSDVVDPAESAPVS